MSNLILKVNGNSMWPLLENGDVISVSKTNSIQKGDIITVHNQYNRILTHRVIDEKLLITKGDNNVFAEKPLFEKPHKLLGKLDYVIKKERKIYINNYDRLFYKYSLFEMNIYKIIKKILPINEVIYVIKKITYSIFIFFFKVFLWKKS